MSGGNGSGGGQGWGSVAFDVPVELARPFATWLGHQAARRGRISEGLSLLPHEYEAPFLAGTSLPEDLTIGCPLGDNAKRRWLRHLGGDTEREPERKAKLLAVRITRAVRRVDVGTATRYDIWLRRTKEQDPVVDYELRDMLANDILIWNRLRPVALDAGLVLAPLAKGQAILWLEEVERAIACARVEHLEAEESETMELVTVLRDLTESSRPWTWSEDDPYPRGLARIEHDGKAGWVRSVLLREVRNQLGRVSRVAMRRARVHLGWQSADWRIETAYLRVWFLPPRLPRVDE